MQLFQVRAVGFCVSCLPPSPPPAPSPRPQPPASDGSVPLRTSTASSGWQCSPPDLNRELQLAVFPAGLKRQLFLDYFVFSVTVLDHSKILEVHLLARMFVTSGKCDSLHKQLFRNRLGTQATSHSKYVHHAASMCICEYSQL